MLECIADLKSKFGENFERLIVTDKLDEQGHQYVNVVQKGRGYTGCGIGGITYILELVGNRFLRLAGTSAGANNTGIISRDWE